VQNDLGAPTLPLGDFPIPPLGTISLSHALLLIETLGFLGNVGNTLGTATGTVGKGVSGVTSTAGDTVGALGKGIGNTVSGVTEGTGNVVKGKLPTAIVSPIELKNRILMLNRRWKQCPVWN
jgi:hypothetical protein